MIRFLASLLGHVRNGLHYVLVAAMYLVSGISGSKAADMAAVAPALFPEMEKRGADRAELAALAGGDRRADRDRSSEPHPHRHRLGDRRVRSRRLFQGGLLPALVIGLMLCALVWYRSRSADMSPSKRATGREIGRAFLIALPALLLPFVIRSAVIEGVATATEVSTIGIAYSFLIGALVYRAVPVVAARARADSVGVAVRRHPDRRRRRHRDGVGDHAIRLFASARRDDQRHAGRTLHLHRAVDSSCSRFSAACSRACRRSCCSRR